MPAPVQSGGTQAQRPLRLLIAEDNPADAELIVAVLKRAGYALDFDIVDTAEQFEQRLRERDYSIVLSDHNLRNWTGMDGLQILGRVGRHIPLVVVTATLGDEAAVDYIKHGAADYILKHRMERLPIAVGQALRERAQREETQRLQEQVVSTKRDWELTFDAVPDAIFLLSEECKILRANRAALELLGLSYSEMIGKNCYEVVHGTNAEVPNCPHVQLRMTGRESSAELEEPRLGKHFHVTTSPLRDASGRVSGCVHSMRDITERKQLEEQLRQAQKMEAVGRLAGGVAHDFNNMLGVILGYTEMMSSALPPDDQRLQGYCEEVHKAGQRASTLTRQLLAFSRRQVLQPKVVALNAVVQEAEGMLRRLIGEDIEVLIDLAPDLWLVKVDAGQINQILLNLAANARDAMPGGGRLALRTGNVTLDESYHRMHRVVAPGEYVLLSVSDTGVGMDDQTRLHIFEPFFTTKEPGKGTGLGLATVYGIVKQSGGFIWVYSEPGHGSTFKVYLPRTLEDASPVALPAARPRIATGHETILLVEDEEAMRAMVRQLLEQGGYRVLEASNGRHALEVAQEYTGQIHLLLSDVVMPEMSGPQLAEHLAQLRPQTRVLFLSGYADRAFEHLGIAPGAALLEKPFNGGGLLHKVREILGGGSNAAPNG